MTDRQWHRVGDKDILPEGRVTTVTAGVQAICLARFKGEYHALDNRCPHQGGPLGEGSIENGWVVCPWHAYEYSPVDGSPPEGYGDYVAAYPVEEREDGIYVGVEPPKPHYTISDQMMEVAADWGLTHVFGMVGHSNLGLADAIRVQEEQGKMTFIGVRHEGAAAFAASAYGKLTGRPAACLGIAGPGSTNLLTGLWDAKVDRAPILALSGQVNTQVLGPGAFQEVDLSAAFNSVAEWSQTVLGAKNASDLMALALKHAIINRDVAHLIFPDEIQVKPGLDNPPETPIQGRVSTIEIAPPQNELEQAIEMIKDAKLVSIICGHGARFYKEQVSKLAETLEAPLITTFKAKGLVADDHPLACGVLGRSGTPVASMMMNRANVLLVLGASFSNHTGIATRKKLIQVDFDRMTLGKFHPVDVPLWGDIGRTCDLLCAAFDDHEWQKDYVRKEIAARWRRWREEKASRAADGDENGLNSAQIFAELSQVVPRDAVICVDVGNNTYSFGRYFESKQGQDVLMSGYLGSIGFAFPAAIGAWAAAPDRPIIAVAGDGGFGQYAMEFTTAVRYGMPIKLFLLNNRELGKISKEQRAGLYPVWQTSLSNPIFAEFARSAGGYGRRVEWEADLAEAFQEAMANDGPALVEMMTDPLKV